jgi:hypothetical protein
MASTHSSTAAGLQPAFWAANKTPWQFLAEHIAVAAAA